MAAGRQPRDWEVMKPYRRRLCHSLYTGFLVFATRSSGVGLLLRPAQEELCLGRRLCTAQCLSRRSVTGGPDEDPYSRQGGEQTAINLVCRRRRRPNQQTSHHRVSRL